MKDIKVTPLPLYKNLSGRSLFESDDPVFMEYRRRWQEQPLQFKAGDFPLFIDIEVTNACNLRCSFCATTYLKAERGFISGDIVYKILDEGRANGLYGVKFNDRGEPLLHPELVDFVRYAKGCGLVDVYFNTNAMLLTQDKAEELIEAGLDRISVSVEGYHAEFYQRYRINASFERLVMNLRNLKKILERKNSKKPLVRIQSVLLPEIEKSKKSYFDKYIEFWSPYADEIAAIEYKQESPSAPAAENPAYPWACHQLWQRMVVRWDGKILPCNEDNQGLFSLGDIRSVSIKEAWNSKALAGLRDKHRKGNAHLFPACAGCALRQTQIKKLELSR